MTEEWEWDKSDCRLSFHITYTLPRNAAWVGLKNPHIKHDEREEREKKKNEIEGARPPSPRGAPLTRICAWVRVLPLVSYSDELMTARTGTDYEPNRRGVRREHRSGGNARRLVSFSAVSPCDNDRVVSRLRVRRRKGGEVWRKEVWTTFNSYTCLFFSFSSALPESEIS